MGCKMKLTVSLKSSGGTGNPKSRKANLHATGPALFSPVQTFESVTCLEKMLKVLAKM